MRNDGFKKEFFTNRQGKDFVLYTGLLDCAHRSGLTQLGVMVLQYPSKDNGMMAVCRAHARFNERTEEGLPSGCVYEFDEVGDASPDNVGRMIAPHVLRMAATRAKARALRDALNIGAPALEELGDDDDRHTGPPVPELAARGFATGTYKGADTQRPVAMMTADQAKSILALTYALNLNVEGAREKLGRETPTAAAADEIITSLRERVSRLEAQERAPHQPDEARQAKRAAPVLDNPHNTPTLQDKEPVGKPVFGVTPPADVPEDRDIPL